MKWCPTFTFRLTVHRFGSGREHYICFGCEVVILQLIHKESSKAGGLDVMYAAGTSTFYFAFRKALPSKKQKS